MDQFAQGGDIFAALSDPNMMPLPLPLFGGMNVAPGMERSSPLPEQEMALAQMTKGRKPWLDPEKMKIRGADMILKALMDPNMAGQRPPGAGSAQVIPRSAGPQIPKTDFSEIFKKPAPVQGPDYLRGRF